MDSLLKTPRSILDQPVLSKPFSFDRLRTNGWNVEGLRVTGKFSKLRYVTVRAELVEARARYSQRSHCTSTLRTGTLSAEEAPPFS